MVRASLAAVLVLGTAFVEAVTWIDQFGPMRAAIAASSLAVAILWLPRPHPRSTTIAIPLTLVAISLLGNAVHRL